MVATGDRSGGPRRGHLQPVGNLGVELLRFAHSQYNHRKIRDRAGRALVPGDWPEPLILIWRLLARLAGLAWLVPGVSRNARAASFAALLGGVYLQQIAHFSWYFAPWTMLGGMALGGLVQAMAASVRTAV